MSEHTKLKGTVVPMATPFTAEGALDQPAAELIVSRLVENGLGVFVLGTTGEAQSMPVALRRRLVEIAVAGAAGKVPVYAGIGDNCVGDSITAGRDFLKHGVDAVVAHLPSYYPLNAAEMEAYFAGLARGVPGPLVIYNIPQTTLMSVPIEVVARLSHLPNVVGFKDSEAVGDRPERLAAQLGGRPQFSIFMGVAAQSVRALRLGFDGLVPSSGNLAPQLWRDLYAAAGAEDWARAEALQRELDAIALVYQRNRSLGQSIAGLKAAMAEVGLCGAHVLPPLITVDAAERAVFRAGLAAAGLIGAPVALSHNGHAAP